MINHIILLKMVIFLFFFSSNLTCEKCKKSIGQSQHVKALDKVYHKVSQPLPFSFWYNRGSHFVLDHTPNVVLIAIA